MRRRRIAAVAAAILAVAGGVLIASGEVPRWDIAGTRMAMPPVLAARPAGAIAVPVSGLVLFVGDSNTAGSRVGGPRNSFAGIFAERQGRRVAFHAFGGATVSDLLARPLPDGPVALAFVMVGTNDAASRGWLSDKRRVPVAAYRRNLEGLVRQLRSRGARIVILAPPPVGSTAMAGRLAPYRKAARQVAEQTGSAFRDPAAAFAPHPDAALLQRDALHLTPEAQRILGLWLLSQTTSASVAGSSSTGKPRPASASHPS